MIPPNVIGIRWSSPLTTSPAYRTRSTTFIISIKGSVSQWNVELLKSNEHLCYWRLFQQFPRILKSLTFRKNVENEKRNNSVNEIEHSCNCNQSNSNTFLQNIISLLLIWTFLWIIDHQVHHPRIPNYDLMRLGKRGSDFQAGFNFPLRPPGLGFTKKRTTEQENFGRQLVREGYFYFVT